MVGAGASGLAAAACLRERGVASVLVLEARSAIQGHWGSQYEHLRVTSRMEHCNLPGYTIDRGALDAPSGGGAGGGAGGAERGGGR